jgi:hypothetical protein
MTANTSMLPIAPGARVLIRDEEWLVRRVDHSNDGGRLLACDGVSELVRGRWAYFLTELEGEIQVLDPAANIQQLQYVALTRAKKAASVIRYGGGPD